MNMRHQKQLNLSLLLGILFFSNDAYAYINPSVFSMIALALAGFLSVVGFYFYKIIDTIKFTLGKIKSFISKK